MRISFHGKEILAGVSLVTAVSNHFPKKVRKDLSDKLFDMEVDLKRIMSADEELRLDLITDFNGKFSREYKQAIRVYLDFSEIELIVMIDPDMLVDISEIIESEVGTLAGLAISVYGLALTFGTAFMRLANNIKHRIKRD